MASPTLFICVVSVGSACGMVAVRKHLEGKARNLGDDVINARLEARRGFAREVVLEFVEQVADGELRGESEFNATAQRREVAKKNNRNAVAAFSPALARSGYAG